MPYTITDSDAHQVVLKRASSSFSSFMFIFVGSVFLLIGIGLNLWMENNEFPALIFKILAPTMGLFAIITGINIPRYERKTTPELIAFDNKKGTVEIRMSGVEEQKAYIPYDEIKKFDLYVESRSSSSSSSRGTRTTTYFYHVYLLKKDGGEWFLTESNSREKAEEILQKLQREIHLHTPCSVKDNPMFPDKLEKDEFTGKTTIRWQNKVSFFAPVFILLFIVAFISILSTVFNNSFFLDSFGMVVIGFILIVFIFVLFMVIKKLIKDATTIYCVLLDRTKLEYQELTKSGNLRTTKAIDFKDIYSIAFSFSPVKDYGSRAIRVLTKKEFDRINSYKENPLQSLKDLFKHNDIIELNFTALNPVEYLQLENWLDKRVKL
ncbi:MAG TPA: hypothetical protein VNB90_13450 [Cytophagaceae bacterium]|nr:hypothetical protein [Cytophagaceae bacterium]